MTDAQFEALQSAISKTTMVIIDMIGGVILATNERGALDTDKLRLALEDVASNPNAGLLERSCVERLLRLVP